MSSLLLVSNRLPVSVERWKGAVHLEQSTGGLVTGLSAFHDRSDTRWMGWAGLARERLTTAEWRSLEKKLAKEYRYLNVPLSHSDIEHHYLGFCNATLWPLFHYFSENLPFHQSWWHAYRRVNEQFADAILAQVEPGDRVWVHDFQLMLLPQMLRERMPELSIGFFLHIPFPSFEILRLLPWRKEVLRGILGSDLIGFHTYDYTIHFLQSVQRFLGLDHEGGTLMVDSRAVKVDAFPLGIDAERFERTTEQSIVMRKTKKLRDDLGEDRTIILSVDRLDYTKGIAQRLQAFKELLHRRTDLKKKVTLILVAVPSRTKVERYRLMKKEIDELVGSINGAYGSMEWTPVRYLYQSLNFRDLVALYVVSDIALITPLRDGMNLVSKEYIASKPEKNGVLILSEMAGAAKELPDAILTNPASIDSMVNALEEAIDMPEEERKRRWKHMRNSIQHRGSDRWAEDFLENLDTIKTQQSELHRQFLSDSDRSTILKQFARGKSRLLLLDYDGTLTNFARSPRESPPTPRLRALLEALAADPRNSVVLISGRRKEHLEEWFSIPRVGLVAEHGMWLRKDDGEWATIETLSNDWKEQVRPMLERFVFTTPGSFLEEKEYSLAWHNRLVDPELRDVRTRELMSFLSDMIRNLPVDVREGHRTIEIKHTTVDKGRAAQHWILDESRDFILAAGDDWTDEDMFEALPEETHTLKVGIGPSRARYRVRNPEDIIRLLEDCHRTSIAKAATRKHVQRTVGVTRKGRTNRRVPAKTVRR